MALPIGPTACEGSTIRTRHSPWRAVDSTVSGILYPISQPNSSGCTMPFGLDVFKRSRLGQRIGAVIENPRNIDDMIVFSRHGMPAVQAVGKDLLALGPEVRDHQV